MPRTNPKLLMMVLLLAILTLSCRAHEDRPGSGSSGLIKDPAVDLTGDWVGDWETTAGFGDAGTVTMRIEQDEKGFLTGTSQWLWVGDRADKFTMPMPGDPLRCWEVSDMKGGVLLANQVTSFTIVEQLSNQIPQGLVRVISNFTHGIDEDGNDELVGTFDIVSFNESTTRCSTEISRLDILGLIFLTKTGP